MADIITKEKCVVIGQVTVPFNSVILSELSNGVRMMFIGSTNFTDLLIPGTSIDGVQVDNKNDLISYLQDNFFSLTGGGSGGNGAVESVTGNIVTGTSSDPIINFPIGDDRQVPVYEDNKVVAKRLGWKQFSDLPTPPPFSNGFLTGTAFQNDGSALWGIIEWALGENSESIVIPNAVPAYNPGIIGNGGGTLPVANAIQDGDAINKSQFDAGIQGLSRSSHTHSFTSITGIAAIDQIPDLTISKTTGLQDSLYSKQDISEKGQANGYTPLDSAGLVPLVHLNVSGLQFKGAWNPNTNTPAIVDGSGSVGDFYKASEAGTFNSGNGNFTYAVGDWVIFAAGIWQRLGSTELVASVNGKIGMVVVSKSDVGLGSVDNVSALQLRDRSTHTGTQALSTITDLTTIISNINATNDAQNTAIQSKANVSHSHSINDITGLQTALNAKQNNLSLKTIGGQSIVGTGNIPIPVDNNTIISTVTANGVKTNEYADRFEYTCKVPFNISVLASNFNTINSTYILPSGVTIDGSDEHYISIRTNTRTCAVTVWDNPSTRAITIGFANTWNGNTNPIGSVFVKLIKYK